MNKKFFFCCSFLLTLSCLMAKEYEGIDLFKNYKKIDLEWLVQFLPYNPIIVEAGAFYGRETCQAAKLWPNGRIIAFEPNPNAFFVLQYKVKEENLQNVESYCLALNERNGTELLNVCYGMKGNEPNFEYASSLLPLTPEMQIYCKGPCVEVSCVRLDDWALAKKINHIDLLRLELEGMELQILKSSPHILKTVKVLHVKTQIHPYRIGMTNYQELKTFLEQSNFILLSHWFTPGIDGHAIFLSRELFDAYFKLSLGLYLDV